MNNSSYTQEQHAHLDEMERLARATFQTKSHMSTVDAFADFHLIATPQAVIDLIHELRKALGFMAE